MKLDIDTKIVHHGHALMGPPLWKPTDEMIEADIALVPL